MYILSRKQNQRVIIDTPQGQMSLTVCKIKNNRVLIGFDAPETFSIKRKEVRDKLCQDQQDKPTSAKG